LALDRVDFDRLLGPLQDIITASQAGEHQSQVKVNGLHSFERVKRERVLKKDLTRIGLLGAGGFGAVELWKHKKTGANYALKGISKGYIVQTGLQDNVFNERNIWLRVSSPFIVTLFATYNGTQSVYYLLEAVMGGQLYETYNRMSFHGSEVHARFYLSGVVFAFEHLHERRIVYRDLKPENLILTSSGHIKLTDMGVAKFVIGKTFTMCGTPDYFAPEIIKCTGHTQAVDWWAWGVLMFELLSGSPPFECNNPMETYAKAVKGIERIPFSGSQEAKGLIHSVMAQNPSDRIPMRAGGTQNLKDASWYEGFKWDDMQAMTIEPPYIPTVKSEEEFAANSNEIELPPHMTYKDDGSGWDLEFAS